MSSFLGEDHGYPQMRVGSSVSDPQRDLDVRRLAEEIAGEIYGTSASVGTADVVTDGAFSRDVLRWEDRIRAFLAERERAMAKKLRAGAGDVTEIFLDARPPGTVDLVYDKLARKIGLPEDCDGE